MGSASLPCETRTNGDSKTYRASPAGLKSPGSKSRPVHFRKLRARICVCAMTKFVCQIESILRRRLFFDFSPAGFDIECPRLRFRQPHFAVADFQRHPEIAR